MISLLMLDAGNVRTVDNAEQSLKVSEFSFNRLPWLSLLLRQVVRLLEILRS